MREIDLVKTAFNLNKTSLARISDPKISARYLTKTMLKLQSLKIVRKLIVPLSGIPAVDNFFLELRKRGIRYGIQNKREF